MDDKNVLDLIKLTLKSRVEMTCNGDTNTFHFSANPNEDEGFELYAENTQNSVYGLSCSSLLEVTSVLLQDYKDGIITHIKVLN